MFLCDIFSSCVFQYAMSFNMNPNKWMLVNFDCSLMWVRDRYKLTQALVVDPLYLQHSYSEDAIDYRVTLVINFHTTLSSSSHFSIGASRCLAVSGL